MSDIKLSETIVEPKKYKVKSYTFLVILILLVIGLVFLTGTIGPDIFILVMFLFLISIPMLILFRNHLISFLPEIVSDSLLEIDHENKEEKKRFSYSPSLYVKEVGIHIISGLLLLASAVFIYKGYKNIDEKNSIMKIMGSLACVVISGVIILQVDYIID